MEKLMIAGIISLICLAMIIPGKPWVIANETGPKPIGPTIEKPIHQQTGTITPSND